MVIPKTVFVDLWILSTEVASNHCTGDDTSIFGNFVHPKN
jgi:hypothetical protein